MNDIFANTHNEELASKAKEAGCEAIYIPDEAGDGSTQWYFAQNYDAGRSCSDPADLQELFGND